MRLRTIALVAETLIRDPRCRRRAPRQDVHSPAVAVRRAVGILVVFGLVGACEGGGGSSEPKRSTDSRHGAAVAAASPGCEGRSTALAPGETTLTMSSGGAQRTYIRHVPRSYRPA